MIQVAAAIIYNKEGKVLIARRREGKSQAGLWEFPGGKIEDGEDVSACLRRELTEEMGIDIVPYEYFGVNEHSYGGGLHIRLIAWKAEYRGGEIVLIDHDDYRWESPGELERFIFAPADIPFVQKLSLEHGRQ
ncbi:(deoxy)nucleoside triphosphate pyrophosphohydrolase [Paenibacillus durus]|uniref:8-oxo-dGTP diphosphatase n=1 Tax=Paenibacillus durus ATCC 35681 TaxID=1333534 RepID=A0A0F7CGE3_PAEDU|nr:(deoxy)nucleoside triphosphate pyrophosphohydrolase [Paenibacillus durus]AKG33456.1 NUDIX hydrolase [Paenibacillus durus ATCC 35681]